MVGKGLLGQYAGFVSRAVGFVLDLLIVIAIIAVVNFAITLPLDYFLGFNPNTCALQVPASLGALFNNRELLCLALILTQTVLSLLTGPAYFILFWSMGGQTIGQYVAGVRVVRLDGRRMNFKFSLVRYLGYFVSFFALGIGYFWVLWDDRRQAWQDKLAKTVVVYAWQARQNEFLLDRVRRKTSRKQAGARSAISATELHKLRYVVVDFKLHSAMNGAMSALEEMIRRGDLAIVNLIVLVKDERGHLGMVGISDLSMNSSAPTPLGELDYRDVRIALERLLDDYPVESFVMAVLVASNMTRVLTDALQRLNLAYDVLTMDTVMDAVREAQNVVSVSEEA